MTARSVWELLLLLLRSWRWDRCCDPILLPCLWWFLICEGSPADTKTKETNYEFSNFGVEACKLWISSRGIIPRKPISKMSKKVLLLLASCCCMDVAVSLLVLLLPFTRINILHRPSQVWQFSMWAVPLFLCLLQSFSCFYCDPLSKANKVTTTAW